MGDSESEASKDLARGRSERYALLLIWGAIIFVGFLIFLYGRYQVERSKASIEWPMTTGRILVSKVTTSRTEDGITHSADIEYSYSVGGLRYSSDVVVIGGHEYRPHVVVDRYPVGTEVSVAYDPDKPRKAVLEPGKLTYGIQQFGMMMMGGALFMAALFDFIFRRSLNEELNLFDHVMIVSFKVIFFPIWYLQGNLWVLGGVVGLAGWLSTLDGSPVIIVPLMFFSAFYGVLGMLLLWIKFMGLLFSVHNPVKEEGGEEEGGDSSEES
ncbi:DUF3592 domain-containing protein [bacterium]|nr:DUF3592 domain-containing protein [bacterium]MDB4460144.1 DUF3592 domain-containing protein [bacterium]